MAALFVILLIVCLAGFFGLEFYEVDITLPFAAASLSDIGISSADIQGFLGIAIVFCELTVIALSMLDQIGDTIKEALRPLARLVPLGAFLFSVWETFSPLMFSLLPPGVAAWFGRSQDASFSIAQAVDSGDFTYGIILTLATMLFFVVINYALGRRRDSAEVKRLRAEVARYKKILS